MSSIRKLALAIADLVLLYVALGITLFIRYPRPEFLKEWANHLAPFSATFIIWLLMFYLADLYRRKAFRTQDALAKTVLIASMLAGVASIILFYLFEDFFQLTPKTNLAIFATVFFLLDYAFRSILKVAISSGRPKAIIMGNSKRAEEIVKHLKEKSHSPYMLSRWIRDGEKKAMAGLPELVTEKQVQTLVVEPEFAEQEGVPEMLYNLLLFEINIVSLSDFYEYLFERVSLDELRTDWFIENIVTRRPFYDAAKRLADLLGGVVVSIIFAIPAFFITLLILLFSGTPIIFAQKRAGKNGEPFNLYKFRTMRNPKNGENWELWTPQNDPRVTGIGKILRFTHLDELPQLWNIIKGDISFIGPRPERIELAQEFKARLPYYETRHVVKPGLSGWAQINYRPSASLEEAKRKLEYEIYYVKNRSFWLDLSITIRTLRYMFLNHE